MPKYWVKNYLAHGSFPEVDQKQKTEEKKKEKRLNDGNNNGQLRIATPPRGAHAKPPGPTLFAKDLMTYFGFRNCLISLVIIVGTRFTFVSTYHTIIPSYHFTVITNVFAQQLIKLPL